MYQNTHAPAEPSRLSHRQETTGEHVFVGRTREVAVFRAALNDRAVVLLHGPGGIGKSALLLRLAAEARRAGRSAVLLDAAKLNPGPGGFRSAVAGLAGQRTALFVDSVQQCPGLEDWIRESFLPTAPSDLVLVLATRHRAGLSWLAGSGRHEALRMISLGGLSRTEATELMVSRGVPAARQDSVWAFAGGHPLALAVGSAVAIDEDRVPRRGASHDPLLPALLDRLVGDIPSPAHRRALEICAHALYTTESLLAAGLDGDPDRLFAWLREQPYIEATPYGLRPDGLVRDLVESDLRWRNRSGWSALRRRIRAHLADEALRARDTGAVLALAYLHRDDVFGDFLTWRGGDAVYEDGYRPGDRSAVLRLAGATADLVAFWLDRQPAAFVVHRDRQTGEPVGFLTWLRLSERRSDEVAADPMVARAWAYAERTAPPAAGEHLGIARFAVVSGGAPEPSPGSDLIVARLIMNWLHSRRLSWSFLVFPNSGRWEPLFEALGHHRLDGELSGTFAHDWRPVPRATWLQHLGDTPAEEAAGLSRAEFQQAVHEALRSWHHRPTLAAGPLVRLGLLGDGDPDSRVEAVRQAIEEAVDALRGAPRLDKLHRVLAAAFFHPATTQKATADRLGLPFSTYRRYLSSGVEKVAEELWRRRRITTAGRAGARPAAAGGR